MYYLFMREQHDVVRIVKMRHSVDKHTFESNNRLFSEIVNSVNDIDQIKIENKKDTYQEICTLKFDKKSDAENYLEEHDCLEICRLKTDTEVKHRINDLNKLKGIYYDTEN